MDASNIITRDNDFIIQEAIQQYCYNESLKLNKETVWAAVKKVGKLIIEKIKKLIAVVKDLIQTAFRKLNFNRIERMYKECKRNNITKVKMEAYPDLLIYGKKLKDLDRIIVTTFIDCSDLTFAKWRDDFDKNNISNLTDYDKMNIIQQMTIYSNIFLIDYKKTKNDDTAMQIVNSNDPTKTILNLMKGNKQTTVLDLDACYQFLQVSYKKSNAYFDKIFKSTLDTINENSQIPIDYNINKGLDDGYNKDELESRYANIVKYGMRMYGYMTSASLEAFQICNKQCIAAIILGARNAGYKDYDDYCGENGRFSREELASDVAYGKISHEDLVAIINDSRFKSNCFGDKARFEKLKANFENKYKDKKMDDEALLLATNASVAEIFNGDYLLYLEQLRIKIKHK